MLGRIVLTYSQQFFVADLERLRNHPERDNGRIALAPFEIAQILLRQSRSLCQLLLRESGGLAEAQAIVADKFAHIHCAKSLAIQGPSRYQL